MYSEMTSCERILAAIRHEKLDRVPMDYWGTAEANEKIMKGIGAKTEDDFIRILHLDKIRSAGPRYVGPQLYAEGNLKADIWGVITKSIPYKNHTGSPERRLSTPY